MLRITRYDGKILALHLKGQSAHEFGCVEKLLSFAGVVQPILGVGF
jgi:hypothetical protein